MPAVEGRGFKVLGFWVSALQSLLKKGFRAIEISLMQKSLGISEV